MNLCDRLWFKKKPCTWCGVTDAAECRHEERLAADVGQLHAELCALIQLATKYYGRKL